MCFRQSESEVYHPTWILRITFISLESWRQYVLILVMIQKIHWAYCFKVGHTERLFYRLLKTINSKRTLSDINAGADAEDNKTDASRERLTNITVL